MKKERRKGIFQWLIPFVCAVVVILILFIDFTIKERQEAVSIVKAELEGAAANYALKVGNELQGVVNVGKTVTQVIARQDSINQTDADIVEQMLTSIVENTGIYQAIYCDKNQDAIDYMGNSVELDGMDYSENLDGVSEIKYYVVEEDSITDSPACIIILPVGEEKGHVILYYPLGKIDELLQISNRFDKDAYAVIINLNGDICYSGNVKSNFVKGDNIWDNIDKEYSEEVSKARVRMKNRITSSIIVSAGGEERAIVYSPIEQSEWVMIVSVSQAYVDKYQDYNFSKSVSRSYILLGVMFLLALVFAVVNYIGSIGNVEDTKKLQKKADTDLLTGLTNKLATERMIKEYMEEYPDSLAMLFLFDVDNFKKINDTMGHAFGDEVLRSLGIRIGSYFRVSDIIGRTGGDEFTIFLKNLQKDENVIREARKLEIFFKNFQVGEYVKYSPTASIGVAVFPTDGRDFETLYKAADQALYMAKKRGKNQLAFFNDRYKTETTVQNVQ